MHTRGRLLLGSLLLLTCGSLAAAQDVPRVPDALRARALAGHRVRVIVGFREIAVPEGRLADAEVAAQRARIRTRAGEILRHLPPSDAARARRFATIPFLAADVDPATLFELERDPAVTSIEEDAVSHPSLAQSAPLVGAPAAWQLGATGAGWTVAVLDTGVDGGHPFLAGRVVAEACYSNAAGLGGGTSLCPGGATSSTAAGSGVNCDALYASCYHGTHVAGIAAGRGSAFSGVAPDAGVIAIQVFTGFAAFSPFCGGPACLGSYSSDQILALERVLALKDAFHIAAVNLSLGGGTYTDAALCDAANPSRKAAIDNLRSAGIATVIAAGNSGYAGAMGAPACISSAISVGSTTKNDTLSPFSNAAPFLKLLAPGSSITSSVPGGGFAVLSGTSMATPHVAGAWAALKSLAPAATVDDVLDALRGTGLSIADTRVTPSPSYPRMRVDAGLLRLATSHVEFDAPGAGAHVAPPFAVSGWALARAAASGTGVDAVHVWAFDAAGSAAFLGAAPYGAARVDVADVFGSQFLGSGFALPVSALPPGAYRLGVYAHNAITGSFDSWAVHEVVVDPSPLRIAIDTPGNDEVVGPGFPIAGWTVDLAASSGGGVDALHVWAVDTSGTGTFLGATAPGLARPDVAAAFGAQFLTSGYALTVNAPPPGAYTLVVYAHSAVADRWTWETRAITVRPPGQPAMSIDTPAEGATATQPFVLTGWAADLDAASDAGVDVLHVWAIDVSTGDGTFVGATTTGGDRPDVGAALGSQFVTAGFNLPVTGLAPGTYQLVVYAHSTVTDSFSQARAVTVTIGP
jgi:subtilisin family serine protease